MGVLGYVLMVVHWPSGWCWFKLRLYAALCVCADAGAEERNQSVGQECKVKDEQLRLLERQHSQLEQNGHHLSAQLQVGWYSNSC